MLDHLDALPQAIGHGDDCPQNLLVPVDAPDTFDAGRSQVEPGTEPFAS
jgi:hypothetical protein